MDVNDRLALSIGRLILAVENKSAELDQKNALINALQTENAALAANIKELNAKIEAKG